MTNALEQIDLLRSTFFGFAEDLLRKHGEFFPFGAALTTDGQKVMIATEMGSEQPSSQEVIDKLNGIFKTEADSGTYDATALFYDARVTALSTGLKGDAIAVALDHKEGVSTVMFFPYVLKRSGVLRRRTIEFAEEFQHDGAHNIFIGL